MRAIAVVLPQLGVEDGEYVIPDPEPSTAYIFDRQGRHLRTMDVRSKSVLQTFEYTEEGKLSSMTDWGNRSELLYNWLIWRVLKLAFFSKKYFPCIYFGVWSSQNNAIFMETYF